MIDLRIGQLWCRFPTISLAARRRLVHDYRLTAFATVTRDQLLVLLTFNWLLCEANLGEQGAFELCEQIQGSLETHAEEMLRAEERGTAVPAEFVVAISDNRYVACPYREGFFDLLTGKVVPELDELAVSHRLCDVNALYVRFTRKFSPGGVLCQTT